MKLDKKRAYRVLVFGGFLLAGSSGTVASQTEKKVAPPTKPVESSWSVHCPSTSRDAPPDCRMEQRAIVTKTGRLLMQVTIRVPAETRKPVMMIHGPLGTFLPAGIEIDVDGSELLNLPFQTCETNGCFAGTAVTSDQLDRLLAGQSLNIQLQSVNKQPINVPMSLIGFTSSYKKIQ
jgi:invasion protein IalB